MSTSTLTPARQARAASKSAASKKLHKDPKPAAPAAPISAAQRLLELAIERGAPSGEISRFMDMHEQHERNERVRAHTAARVALLAEGAQLERDRYNEFFGNNYITLGKLVGTMSPLLAKHGLAVDWRIDQSDNFQIEVMAVLSHIGGHATHATLRVPKDMTNEKNEHQGIKSAITYARAITYEAVCGLASTDANIDDDANSAGPRSMAHKQARTPGPASVQKAKREIQPASEELLERVRAVANKGHAVLGAYWRESLTEDERLSLNEHMADLTALASAAAGQAEPH